MFDILRLPSSTDSAELANRYESEQARALQEGDTERAEQWGARADAERYISSHVEGKVRNYRDS
jgi:hypothetical protein